jgi:hypothetical protein
MNWALNCDHDEAIPALLPEIFDICLASYVSGPDASFLLVLSADSNSVWLSGSRQDLDGNGQIYIRKRTTPAAIDMEFMFEDDDPNESVRRSHESFLAWLGDADLLPAGSRVGLLLTVKVAADSLWFLRFPLNLYTRLQLNRFSSYSSILWIVTQRTLLTNAVCRWRLKKGLNDLATLIGGTVVVLNEYKAFLDRPEGTQIRQANDLLQHLLRQYENVFVDGKPLSLRWLKNPSVLELSQVLLSDSTKLFFAGFEAGEGRWQMSDVADSNDEPSFFDLGLLKGRLAHVLLLRVFHCNSIFDPISAASREGQPADQNTIARELLETDAGLVEGGLTVESYFDFVCSVILHFFGTSLRSVLDARQVEGKLRLPELISACNELLDSQGYVPIPN